MSLVEIGRIKAVKGITGQLRFKLLGHYDSISAEIEFLMLGKPDDTVPYKVKNLIRERDTYILELDGVNGRTEAETLKGSAVFLDEELIDEKLSLSAAGEWKSIEGYLINDTNYGDLGKIDEILFYPSQVTASLFYKEKEVLIPLVEEFILEIDHDEETLFTQIPEGLLEVYINP